MKKNDTIYRVKAFEISDLNSGPHVLPLQPILWMFLCLVQWDEDRDQKTNKQTSHHPPPKKKQNRKHAIEASVMFYH